MKRLFKFTDGLTNGQQTYRSGTLIRRFFPYLYKYRGLLALDLFFASLTTLCDIALPVIMRRLTNSALGNADHRRAGQA